MMWDWVWGGRLRGVLVGRGVDMVLEGCVVSCVVYGVF